MVTIGVYGQGGEDAPVVEVDFDANGIIDTKSLYIDPQSTDVLLNLTGDVPYKRGTFSFSADF